MELHAGLRPDVLADAYYQDAEQDWTVYLANQIVDPYYGWYLSEEEFNSFIIDKYTDLDEPKRKIKFYRNNWASDDTEITPSFYENTLSLDQKQYYSPVFATGAKITAYVRKAADWTTNTNKIFQYTITYNGNSSFIEGELIQIKSGNSIQYPNDGTGEVVCSNTTALIIQHISGNTIANSTWTKTLVGETSNTTAISTEYLVLKENISNAEAIFWNAVSWYDWELEQNEQKKHVYVLNPDVIRDVSNNIRKKIQE